MTIEELVSKGFIDVDDDIAFARKKYVMNLFGFQIFNMRESFYPHPHEESVHLWFPIMYPDDENAWSNTWGVGQEMVFERRKEDNAGYLEEQFNRPDRHVRIMFAKLNPGGRREYKFKGLYVFDAELARKAKAAVYVRTSRQVQLYPI